MKKSLQVSAFALGLFFLAEMGFSQNLLSDVVNSNLDGLKAKVALLSPTFKEAPYLDVYFSQTQNYSEAMTDYLIENGADINAVDDKGLGPLYYAIAYGHREAVTKLLLLKVSPNSKWPVAAKTIPNLVTVQIAQSFDKNTQALIDKANKRAFYYATPLWAAEQLGDPVVVKTLLDRGADPLTPVFNTVDADTVASTKLKYVTRTIFDAVVERLAASTTNRRGRLTWISPEAFYADDLIWTSVLSLPTKSQPKVAPALMNNIFADFILNDMKDFKAELLKTGDNTMEFVPYAVLAKNWDVVDLIFKYNSIDISQPSIDTEIGTGLFSSPGKRKTLVVWCIENGHLDALGFLHEHGVSLTKEEIFTTKEGAEISTSPLAFATIVNREDLARVLIDQKVDLNVDIPLKNCTGDTSIRDDLLNAGANINVTFPLNDKTTPVDLLFAATAKHDLDGVKYYLAKGLDPNRSPDASPLIMAVASANPAIAATLLNSKARTDIHVSNGSPYNISGITGAGPTPLQLARALMKSIYDQEVKVRFQKVIDLLTQSGEAD